MSNKTVLITRRSRKIGYGINVTPTQKWNKNFTNSHLFVEKPSSPDFEGTLKQVFDYIKNDKFIQSVRSSGTYYNSAFFVNGELIDTDFEAWQYEIDRLVDGEIDSLTVPLI